MNILFFGRQLFVRVGWGGGGYVRVRLPSVLNYLYPLDF
jgi:hypothetical protein